MENEMDNQHNKQNDKEEIVDPSAITNKGKLQRKKLKRISLQEKRDWG